MTSNLNNSLNALTDELKRHRRRASNYGSSDDSSNYSQEADGYYEHDYDDCEDLDNDGICDDSDDDFDGDDDCDCD
ncbi:MAG: hypothetical protein F6K23_16905 [Okeania sp. SIO2C9]|uniref:hypothetical protein n=1 Tax=Okeania sp. SIO2C9 TaxID=2607791 RepID=UPI0013C1F6F9|nr:hypothetical protein [Okeania sp. SIO2C9]NEQ74567.1 hypothetical protein [Okeania sp. SIO2C9]